LALVLVNKVLPKGTPSGGGNNDTTTVAGGDSSGAGRVGILDYVSVITVIVPILLFQMFNGLL
jgi:hypothetical protein